MFELRNDNSSSSSSGEDDESGEENENEALKEESPAGADESKVDSSGSVGTFESLGVTSWIRRQLSCLGITTPSPVQAQCIPPVMEGN